MRLLKQGVAGLFQVGSPQCSASRRISGFVSPHSAKGLRTFRWAAARRPGRYSPWSSRLLPSATTATPDVAPPAPPRQTARSCNGSSGRTVGLIRGQRDLAGGNDLVTDADLPGKFPRLVQLAGGQTGIWPVTATARSPRANCAALASTVLSSPPENATAQLP